MGIKAVLLHLLPLCFGSQLLMSQQVLRVEFEEDPIVLDTARMGIAIVNKCISDSIDYRGAKGRITFPDNFIAQDTGYIMSFFTGFEYSHFKRVIMILVENYKQGPIRMWVDHNANLDFSDDDGPISAQPDGSFVVSHRNSDNPEAKFTIKLIQKDRDSAEIQMFEQFFGSPGLRNGSYQEEVQYWFSNQRMNTREFKGKLGDVEVRLGLHDYDCDGKFARNGKDRVLVSEDFSRPLSTRVIDGAAILGDTCVVVIGNQAYEVMSVEETGDYIELRKSELDIKLPLKIGSSLPNYTVSLADEELTLRELMANKDYLFVDIWGAWCKGCVSQVEDVKQFAKDHAENVAVVGLNYGDSQESKEAFIKKYELQWPDGDLSEEISTELNIEGYPTYLLIDKNLKLIMYENSVYRIDKYLNPED